MRRGLASYGALIALLGWLLSGCGTGDAGKTTHSDSGAQPVVVSPTSGSAMKVGENDLVFAASLSPAKVPVVARPFLWVSSPAVNARMNASKTGELGALTVSYPSGYLTPAQMRHAYGVDQIVGDGTGQTIAIVNAYGSPTIQSDLAAFSTAAGLPQANLTIAYQGGGPPSSSDAGWALETSLDVEWAHAIAPGANLLLVVAQGPYGSDLLEAESIAISQGAKQVSNSWGGGEFSGQSSYDSYFSAAGVTVFAASGDNGSGVSWPAISSAIVSVGGTHLSVDRSGNVLSESGWSDSGGGLSDYLPIPSYQSANSAVQAVCGSKRGNPDVSYNGDPNSGVPVYMTTPYYGQTGWFGLGGTSAGSPQWAAICAIANQARVAAGASTINGANNLLYTFNQGAFRDITAGSNGGFNAAAGYDLVTGLGSPTADTINALVSG
ncbi:MAG: hypothetical protein EB084_20360, partial [Proteobacteria bacterium]|nr:hypothetical protein [Pseudomonadota bacterium]